MKKTGVMILSAAACLAASAADGRLFGAANEVYRLESKIRIVKDRPVTIRFKYRGIE